MKSLTKNQKEILAALTAEFNAANAIVPTTPLSEALATIQAIIDTKKASEAAETLRLELREIRRIDFLSQIITLVKPIAEHFEININEIVRLNYRKEKRTVYEFKINKKGGNNIGYYCLIIDATYDRENYTHEDLCIYLGDTNNVGNRYLSVTSAYNCFLNWIAQVTE